MQGLSVAWQRPITTFFINGVYFVEGRPLPLPAPAQMQLS